LIGGVLRAGLELSNLTVSFVFAFTCNFFETATLVLSADKLFTVVDCAEELTLRDPV